MNIVIVGAGKVGLNLIKHLSLEDHNVTVIEKDEKLLENVVNNYDVLGICGNGANFELQKEAGVEKARLLIAATSSDELNVMCCMIAKKVGARHTIARVRNPEYSRQLHFLKEELGLSMAVNPELEAANEISRILRFPSAIKIDSFSKGRVELADIRIKENNPLVGKPISDIYKEYKVEILVCAVRRKEKVYIPSGDFVLEKDDKISITASRKQLSSFLKQIGIYEHSAKNTMIIGGGRIGYYLASQLLELGFRVKIIEIDHDRCLELSRLLPKAEVICAYGTDKEVLTEYGVEQQDGVVCLAQIDEENIITSLYVSSLGVKKTVTKVNRVPVDVLSNIGVESVISPKNIAANRIVQYIRALSNSDDSGVKTMYELVDGEVEALEFHIDSEKEYTSVMFKDLPIKDNILICCLIRNNKLIFPRGDDTIEVGDNVIVLTNKQKMTSLNDIFK